MNAKLDIITLIQIIVKPTFKILIALSFALFAVLFEGSFVGLAFGTRFEHFAEFSRARFIDQKGVWLGILIIGARALFHYSVTCLNCLNCLFY